MQKLPGVLPTKSRWCSELARPWRLAVIVGLIAWVAFLEPAAAEGYAVPSAALVVVLLCCCMGLRFIESDAFFAGLLLLAMIMSVSGATFAYVALGGADGGGALHPLHPYVLVFAAFWAAISVVVFLVLRLASRLATGLCSKRSNRCNSGYRADRGK